MKSKIFLCAFVVTLALPLFAHEGRPENTAELIRSWAWEPVVLIALGLSGWLYTRGIRRLKKSASNHAGIKQWEILCYAGGWFALFVALVSPLHTWGQVLFSAHMTQHEILMLVAAPLLVLGRPMVPYLWALPLNRARSISRFAKSRWWQTIWRAITRPFVAWVIHAIALWTWHIPYLFQATIRNEFIHTLQHLSFLLSALLFWWALVHGRASKMGYGVAVLYMFTTAMHSGLLGALLTFSTYSWYPVYAGTTQSWGLTTLQDQRIGGLIMWIPAGSVYVIAGLALFAGWMRESERAVVAAEDFASLRLKTIKDL